MRGARRLLSRLSMVVGAGLFVAGIAMRAGVLGTAHGAVGPTTGAPSGAVVALATPTTKAATPAPTIAPTPTPIPPPTPTPTPTATPPPTPTPEPSGELVFADDFDTVAAWPTGKVTGGKAQYASGWYVLSLVPIDLPVYITPAAGDGPLAKTLTVEATLALAGSDVQAGPFVADAHDARIGVLLSVDGRVTIVRDSIESFDVLGSGSTTPPGGPVRITLVIGPSGTSALVDGHPVATVHEHLVPASFGLIVWSQTASGTVKVDHFEARAPGG